MYIWIVKKILRYIIFIFLAFSCSYLPEESVQADEFLKSDNGDYAMFYSANSIPDKAMVFIPGGLVDPFVYACWIEKLVERSPEFAVLLMKYPSNLAISNIGKASKIINEFENVNHWIIGGHSLGGVVAATLVSDYPDSFDGLVLMASWSREATNLSEWEGSVLSFYASEDQLATAGEVETNSIYLPEGTQLNEPGGFLEMTNKTYYYEIEGGNHAGFGCYGAQDGDGDATITPVEQQEQLINVLQSYVTKVW